MKTATDHQLGAENVPGSGDVPGNALRAGNVDATAGNGAIEIDEMIHGNEIVNVMMILLMTGVSETTVGTDNAHPVVQQKKQR